MIIIFFIILKLILASDLSTSNCPTSFNILDANLTLASDISFNDRMAKIYDAFRGNLNSKRIQNIVISGNTSDLNTYILNMSYAFLAIGTIYFFIFFMIVICNTFEKKCPPCESLRRDFAARPYKKHQMRCVSITSFAFSIILLAVSIFSFTSTVKVKKNLQYTKCAVYTVLDVAINGDLTNSWGGFSYLTNQVGNISSSLQSSGGNLSLYFPYTNTWLVTQKLYLTNLNMNLYNRYSNSTVATPNPSAYSSTTSSSVNTTIVPQFISQGLGPNQTKGTMVNTIDSSLRNTDILTTQALSTNNAAQILLQQISTLTVNLKLSSMLFNMYNTRLSNLNTLVDGFNEDYFQQALTWGIYLIEGIIGFILASCVINMIGIILTYIFDLHNCRMMVHLSWVIFGIMYFGVIISIFLFIPGGIVGNDFCKYYSSMMTNQSTFQSLGQYYSQNVFTNIETCLYGDTNVLNGFNANEQISTINRLFNQINIYTNMTNSNNSAYVDITQAKNNISYWVNTITNYRDGVFVDYDQTITTESNPVYALYMLNVKSQRGVASETCAQDQWVFSKLNCTYNPVSQNPKPSSSIKMCLSFNNTASSSSQNIWSQSDFTNRYINIRQNCPNTYQQLIDGGFAIINYRDSRINLYQSILNDLTILQTTYNNFMTNHSVFQSNINNFIGNMSTLNGLINNKQSGLNISKNCSVIASNLKFVYNSFCVNTINYSYKLAIAFFIFGVIMIGAIITGSVFANRYAKVEKQLKVLPDTSSQHIKQKSQDMSSSDND